MSDLLVLLTLHFVGDFVCQSDWMAQNKSKRWDALAAHVALYSLVVTVGAATYFEWLGATFLPFFALTFALHFATDAVTSRINSRLWAAKKVHWFFVGIGADQLLHAYALAWTWHLVSR